MLLGLGLALVAVLVLGVWWMLDAGPADDGSTPKPPESSVGQLTPTPSSTMKLPEAPQTPRALVPSDQRRSTPQALAVAGDGLRVVVLTKTPAGKSRPVQGADVLPVIDGKPGTHRKTNADGRVVLPLSELMSVALQVRAGGFTSSTVAVKKVGDFAHSGKTLQVMLRRTYSIHGRVTCIGSEPVPAGVAVLAWQGKEPPALRDGRTLLDLERKQVATGEVSSRVLPGALMLTRTEFGGNYRFPKRVPGGRWSLRATGLGLTQRVIRVSAETKKGFQLRAWSAHSLAVQVTDPQGVPIAESRGVSRRGMSWPAGSKLSFTEFSPVERLLLDIEPRSHWGPVKLIDVGAPELVPTAGPVRINFKEPGFKAHSESLEVPSTRDGLKLHTISLEPNGDDLGELTLVLEGWDAHVGDLAKPPLTSVNFTTAEGGREHVYLKDIQDDRVTLTGLPYGTYEARLDVGGLFGSPTGLAPVEISATPATLTFDLTQFASLDIELVAANDKLFDGRASVFMGLVEGTSPGAGFFYSFNGPPYRIPFLALHKWQVTLRGTGGWRWTGHTVKGPVVDLSAGETGRAQIVIGGR